MSKFKRVLSDEWLPLEFKSGNDVPVTSLMVNLKTLKSIVEQAEQAVLAKLAEQEPVIYLYAGDLYAADDMGINDHIREHGTPLYAQPCVAPVRDKTTCVSQNEKCATKTSTNPTTSIEAGEMNKDETINETIQILEDLIQAIKERNLNRFDDLTYDTEGAYCSGQGLAVIADLESTRFIIEGESK